MTTRWHCVERRTARWFESWFQSWFKHSNQRNRLHFIAADISPPKRTCAITYIDGLVRNPPVFRLRAMGQLVKQTWQPLFVFFSSFFSALICDVLTGRSWSVIGSLQPSIQTPSLDIQPLLSKKNCGNCGFEFALYTEATQHVASNCPLHSKSSEGCVRLKLEGEGSVKCLLKGTSPLKTCFVQQVK